MHRYITEFIGTFFLILTIGLVSLDSIGIIAPLAIGSILMTMVYAGGHISGAHYNPAITLGVWLRGGMTTNVVLPYMLSQVIGSLAAAFLVLYLKPNSRFNTFDYTTTSGAVFLAEFLFTFALVYVVLNVATARDNAGNSFYGLAIGFTVLAGAFAVGTISGGLFNPAVAVGLAKIGFFGNHLQQIALPIVAQFLGGAAAAYVYLWVRRHIELEA